MDNIILKQFIALSLYTLCMGFCFCDGFRLHFLRKLIWFSVYAFLCIFTFKMTRSDGQLTSLYGRFDLPFILASGSL